MIDEDEIELFLEVSDEAFSEEDVVTDEYDEKEEELLLDEEERLWVLLWLEVIDGA